MEEIYCAALADLLGHGAARWVPRFQEAFGSYEAGYKASRQDVAERGLLVPALENAGAENAGNLCPNGCMIMCISTRCSF